VDKWLDTYAVFDIETDGLSTKTCLPTELATMLVIDGMTVDFYETLIWRSREQTIHPRITDITGITNEMCHLEGIPIARAMNRFWAVIQHFPLIGHNIGKFDIPIIDRFRPPWCLPARVGADTADLFRVYKLAGVVRWPTDEEFARMHRSNSEGFKFNLGVACAEFGVIQNVGKHRGMVDTEYTRQLYMNMRKARIDP